MTAVSLGNREARRRIKMRSDYEQADDTSDNSPADGSIKGFRHFSHRVSY